MSELLSKCGDDMLRLAAASVKYGLETGKPLQPDAKDYPDMMVGNGASFVTLNKNGELRGCIGTVTAWQSLVDDIAENAFNAAFCDPRFAPLSKEELPETTLSVSVLTEPEPMSFESEEDLLAQIEPEIDGLVFEDKGKRGLFLPIVWEMLPEKEDFLAHLKLKAGLPMDYWSPSVKIFRFRAEAVKSKEKADIWE